MIILVMTDGGRVEAARFPDDTVQPGGTASATYNLEVPNATESVVVRATVDGRSRDLPVDITAAKH